MDFESAYSILESEFESILNEYEPDEWDGMFLASVEILQEDNPGFESVIREAAESYAPSIYLEEAGGCDGEGSCVEYLGTYCDYCASAYGYDD